MLGISRVSGPPRWRCLALIAAALGVAFGWHGPMAQWADYHAFADTRPWLGVPNAANVLSNLPFAAIGVWGLWQLLPMRRSTFGGREMLPWLLFCLALVCTAAGSALYHWSPNNAALVTDRLPIAWACAALLCGFLGERVHARWAAASSLGLALGAATLSVAFWWWTEQRGLGDLRAYLLVQLLPMLLVPAALGLKLPARRAHAVPALTWWWVLGLYAAAKGMEMADHWMFNATQGASGHMLKHLLAAGAAGCLVAAVVRCSRTQAARVATP